MELRRDLSGLLGNEFDEQMELKKDLSCLLGNAIWFSIIVGLLCFGLVKLKFVFFGIPNYECTGVWY